MPELSSLFENLYNRFILRDLFAKIVPGSIILFSTATLLTGSLENTVSYFTAFSFWPWLLIISLCWVLGFLAQETGMLLGLITDHFYAYLEKKDEKSLLTYYKENIAIHIDSDANYQKALERIVVIKEACGNTSISFGYVVIIYLIRGLLEFFGGHHHVHTNFHFTDVKIYILILLIGGAAFILQRAHKFHAKRQDYYKKAYFEYMKERAEAKPIPPKAQTENENPISKW